jgi:hypothetical protein
MAAAVGSSPVGAPKRLDRAHLHRAAPRTGRRALVHHVVTEHGPREGPAIVAALREVSLGYMRLSHRSITQSQRLGNKKAIR